MTQLSLSLDLLRDLLVQGRVVPVRYRGVSMAPTFRDWDDLLVRSPEQAKVRVGSIVVYTGPEGWVAHRVVKRAESGGGRGYFTRGDAFLNNDLLVAEAQIIGTVVGFVRDGRKISLEGPRWKPAAEFLKTKYLPWKVRVSGWLRRSR